MNPLRSYIKSSCVIAGFLIAHSINAIAFADFISDTDPHPTPDIPRPGYLEPMTDPVFGSTVIRITDAGQPIWNPTGDPSLVGRNWGDETGHGYSSRVSWNADQTLLAMDKGVSGFVLLDGETYEPLFQRSIRGGRWHPTNPDTMLYVNNRNECIGEYDVWEANKVWELCLGGFTKLDWGSGGKGKPSVDGNIIPLRGQRSDDGHWVAMLYYIDTDTLSEEFDMLPYVDEGTRPDFIISPLGDTIIVTGCIIGHTGRCKAQMAFDWDTKQELWRELRYHNPGHADEMIDDDGEQWRVGRSKEGTGGIIARNFRTGEERPLVEYAASHTSTRNIHGAAVAVLSYHTPSGGPFQREIVGVCIDGSCLERYAHTHRADDGRYLTESQASVSPFGDRIVFRSNWDEKGGLINAYVIELSGRSSSGLGSTPETTPTVTITAPESGSSFDEGNSIAFIGTANDAEDGDLTASLTWSSSLGGAIGTGGSFWTTLSVGVHSLTASAMDSGGLTNSAQIIVTVNASPDPEPQDTEAPTLEFLNLRDGDMVKMRAMVEIEIDARDNIGIRTVEIYIDGTVHTVFVGDGPYNTVWKVRGKPGKSHEISAIARDHAGNQSSAAIQLQTEKKTR